MSKLFSMSKKDLIVVLITIIFMFGGQFIPVSEDSTITSYGVQVVMIFIGLIIGWCASSLFWPSILAIPALALTPYGDAASVIMGAFNNSTILMILLGFIAFAPMSSSGVGEILCNKLLSLKFFKGKPFVFILTMYIGFFILSGQSAISTPLIILTITLFGDMCRSIGYKNTDRFPVFFLMGLIIAIGAGRCFYPFVGWPLMTVYTLSRLGEISYLAFWAMVIPGTIIFFVLYTFAMKLFRCDFAPLKNANINVDANKLTMTTYQKSVLIYCLTVIVALIVVGVFGKASGNAFQQLLAKIGIIGVNCFGIFCGVILKSDDKPILDMKTAVRHVPLDMIFMFAIAILVSSILTADGTGISQLIQSILIPIMSSTSTFGFILILAIATFVLTNLANNMVIVYTMLAVVGSVFTVNPGMINITVAGTMISFLGILGILLPSASVYGAIVYGSDMTTPKNCFIAGLVAMIILILVAAVYMIPVGLLLA